MRLLSLFLAATSIAGVVKGGVIPRQDGGPHVGYLLSTFTDPDPRVFWYLSDSSDPLGFKPLNGGDAIVGSTVGTQAVRDIFLASNTARSEYFIIATDLDINAPNFSWDQATRQGSLALTIWKSDDLVDWSEPTLTTIEDTSAGMAWAPSAVWNDDEQQYYLFWASRLYESTDPEHTGTASPDRIRYSTTKDFVTFSTPADYLAPEGIPVIDQEFQSLGTPGAYSRFIKDENLLHVYQETTTDGLFGDWTRVPGYIVEEVTEGPAAFRDIENPDRYYLLLDNYTEYVPFVTNDILNGGWELADATNFPTGLKHGSVFMLTQGEYDAVVERYMS